MNYQIMHKDEIIALADDNGITHICRKELCPACFTVGMPLEYWLENRSVDVHRSHSRQLFKALRLLTDVRTEQLIEVGHGISITDNWWVQKEGENLSFSDLKEYNEAIADIALCGSSASASDITRGYKELGTVGSYEKCWRYIDNSWYMYKQGSTSGEILGLSPYFDYNLALISAGIPRIDSKKGNLYVNSFLENKICCEVLRNHFPDRDKISETVKCATSECRKVFDISSFNYSLVENYILDTCQYLSEHL